MDPDVYLSMCVLEGHLIKTIYLDSRPTGLSLTALLCWVIRLSDSRSSPSESILAKSHSRIKDAIYVHEGRKCVCVWKLNREKKV